MRETMMSVSISVRFSLRKHIRKFIIVCYFHWYKIILRIMSKMMKLILR